MRRTLTILAVVLLAFTGCASVDRLGKNTLVYQAENLPHRALKGQAPDQLDRDRRAYADESADLGKRMADWRTWVVPFGAAASDMRRYQLCMEARGYEVDVDQPIATPKPDGPPR